VNIVQELFGPIDEVEPMEKPEEEQKEVALEELYEPGEMKGKYVTEADKKIKETDIPERMQLYLSGRLEPTEEQLNAEATWIWKQRKEKDPKDIIKSILKEYLKEHHEMPFIYNYRKHVYNNMLEKRDLWHIFKLDKQWGYLSEQKDRLMKRLTPIVDVFKAFKPTVDKLQNSQELSEIEDISGFIDFYQDLLAIGKDQGVITTQTKVSSKQIRLSKWLQGRIPELADKIFLKSHEFVENLKHMQLNISPPDVKVKVKLLAKEYISEQGKDLLDEQHVLTALIKYAAEELASHPEIRKTIREYYQQYAVVSTEPTSKGLSELDVFHPSYRVKRIVKRPLKTFQDDLWLDIRNHEIRGFINVKVGLEEEKLENLRNQLLPCYMQTESVKDEILSECNALRKETLETALRNHLILYGEQQARRELELNAEEYVLEKCAEHFREQLMAGPYRATNESAFSEGNKQFIPGNDPGVKVLSLIVDLDAGRKAVVQMAMLDNNGELMAHQLLYNIVFRKVEKLPPSERTAYEKDLQDILNFIKEYKPDLIVIAANRLEAQTFKYNLCKCIHDEEEKQKLEGPWVSWVDPTIPKIYSTTDLASKQVPDKNPLLRMAVSQARLKQDPMSEILNLWGVSDYASGIFSIPMHPLQKQVNHKKLEEVLEQIAVECVNDIGIDINKIIDHPHLHKKLEFICGLGPRKAQDIVLMIQKKGRLMIRSELNLRGLSNSKSVFANCVGFIKVCTETSTLNEEDLEETDERIDLRDLTRIHPEFYDLVDKIVEDACEDEQEKNKRLFIAKVMKNEKLLDKFDIKKYKEDLEKAQRYDVKFMVDFVLSELRAPFKDPRQKSHELVNEELFYLLMNETKQTFFEGMLVSATILKAYMNEKVICKLENGMDAYILKADLIDDDSEWNIDISKKFTENSVIPARIKQISMSDVKLDVKLTTRKQDLRSHANWLRLSPEDRKFFYVDPSDLENKRMIEEERKKAAKYAPRKITHKKFKNLSLVKATEYLANRDIGDYIFRPSSRGENHLTLTYKFYKNTYAHVDIREEDKPLGAPIGRKLYIGNEVYESLDEINARYISPIIEYSKETSAHRKFVDAISMKVIEDHLNQEQQKNKDIISYCFAILPEYPQYVILAYYLKKDKLIKEFIKVKPQGYAFHENTHKNLAYLIGWFKQHCAEPEYQRFVRKYNKPPVLIQEKREPQNIQRQQDKSEGWEKVNIEWREEEKESKEPPVNPMDIEGNLQNDQSNTQYLPKTDYNRAGNTTSQGETPGSRSNYPAKFSTYDPEPSYSRKEDFTRPEVRSDPRRGSGRTMVCYNCNQEGHMAKDCPNPRTSRGDRGGRGGRGGFRGDRSERGGRGGRGGRGDHRPEAESSGGWGKSDSWGDAEKKPDENAGSWGEKQNEPMQTNESNAPWGAPSTEGKPSYSGFNTVDDKPTNENRGWGDSGHSGEESSRRGRGRGSSRGGRGCFNCGQEGHMAKDCPQPRKEGRGEMKCFKCGKPGHMSRDCPEGGSDFRGRGRHGDHHDRRSRSRSHSRSRSRSREHQKGNTGWGAQTTNNAENNKPDSGW